MNHLMPIIILAAGGSTRMQGRDKLLEPVGGVPLLRQQAIKALALGRGPVIVALPPRPHARYDAVQGLDVRALPVPDAAEGMNASLRAGIAALPPHAPWAMVLLGDLPDLTVSDLALVADAAEPEGPDLIWRGATASGAAGHPIVFRSSLFAALSGLRGDSGGREVVSAHADRVVLIPLPGDRARLDLDTPAAWAAWRAGQGAARDS
ncbi:molybdopterin-guanine dinucleotide biosynthesis protein MobA [Sulfitobacter sp. THAF37]|uniref:nucleotidyltransferase family protein n=1 Tax=Sulfitobacter sp. THAF37 TaxID=2587855 RepID=UPI0012683C0E|nr:nucleotidyltransferase family protein [Sulfitobacter sp. THAF37]QFT60092.1 molybdopterin-guanine dinucleotide biosynthesis protein MobA [Sulfitobacter sp. THAF37]